MKRNLLHEIQKWAGKYQFNFQFWGEGNNNVYIMKDDVDLWDSGGYKSPEDAMQAALDYIKKINP